MDSAPGWVPSDAIDWYKTILSGEVSLFDPHQGRALIHTPPPSDDHGEVLYFDPSGEPHEFLAYYQTTLKQLIESNELKLFWQWLTVADKNHGRGWGQNHYIAFLDTLVSKAYRAKKSGPGRAANRKTKLIKEFKGKSNSLLPELVDYFDLETRRYLNKTLELLAQSEAFLTQYDKTAKRGGCPWVKFAAELHEYSGKYFIETPLANCRLSELVNVLDYRSVPIPPESVNKAIRNLTT